MGTIVTTSTITWKPVAEGLPDADSNVLLGLSSGFTCEGFWDGEVWRDVTAVEIEDAVCAWSEMPMFDSHANTPPRVWRAMIAASPATPVVPNLAHKPTVQHLMDLARKLRSAPGDLYDGPYKALQNACYAALSATPVVREPQPETSRLLANVADAARRLVEHADFQLGGILSADSKAKDIPSKAVSQVKARHLASLRDRVAELDAANGITGGSNG